MAELSSMNYGYPKLEDIQVGSRYFFFESLRDEPLEYAQDVYKAAMNILEEHSSELTINENGEGKINDALNFLKQAYEYEAALEKNIWETRVLNILKGTEYEKMARGCFSGKEIDYIGFINLLGIIETDAKDNAQWKRRLAQQYEEILQFNNEISAINKDNGYLNANPDLLNVHGPNALIARLYKNGYGDRRQISAWTQSMLKTKPINNALLGYKGSPLFRQVIPDVNKIVTMLMRGRDKKIKLNDAQRLGLRSEIAHAMMEELYDSRKDENGVAENLESITYEEFERMFFNIKSNGKREVDKEQLKKLQSICEKLLNNLDLLQEEGNNIRKTPKERIREGKDKNSTPAGLTKPIRARLEEILKELRNGKTLLSKYGEQSFTKKAVRQQFWRDLKSELLPLMESESKGKKQFDEKDYINYINKLLSQNSSFTIYDETEYRGAYGLSNILKSSELNDAIAIKVVGQLLGKTDVSGLIIPLGELKGQYEINGDAFSQEFLSKFEKDQKEAYEQQRKIVSKQLDVYINEKDKAMQLFTQSNSFSIRAQTEATKKAQAELKTNIEQNLRNITSDDEKDAEKITEALKNILIVDETTKFAERYFEGYGFKGGSLGANIYEQIDNICALFEMGGIDHIDQQWLAFATLNSGDALIGFKLRPSLEDYFSTVASLLMFQSGGILAEQIKNNLEPKIENDGFIRIYRLGPLFVPNSYILKKTYDALVTANDQMYREAEGSRAMIRNNVTEPLKERKKETEKNKFKSVWLWEETYKTYMPKVSINIQLLGGFLDILEQLRERMSNL